MARATGALRFNREIAAKGEPQGYMVMEFTSGVTSGEIRVTDLFGNVYIEKITW